MNYTKEHLNIRSQFINRLMKDSSINWLEPKMTVRDLIYLYGVTLDEKYSFASGYKEFLNETKMKELPINT